MILMLVALSAPVARGVVVGGSFGTALFVARWPGR